MASSADNWTFPPTYDKFGIYSTKDEDSDNQKSVDLRSAVQAFSYYESLFSPIVTASMSFLESGTVRFEEDNNDTQDRSGTVLDTLPINGKEKVRAIIKHGSGVLSFDDYPLQVDLVTKGMSASGSQMTHLHMASKFAFDNEEKSVDHRSKNNIRDSVYNILKNDLGVPDSRMILEKTQNELEFPGEGNTPFEIILDLAPVSKPVRGSAGYFFWETKGGFNFRSIDSLIRQRPADQYTTDQDVPSYGAHANCRILDYYVVKNEDELTKLRSGVYKSRLSTFNAATQLYDETDYSLSDLSTTWNAETLGSTTFGDYSAFKDSLDGTVGEFTTYFPSANNGSEQFEKDGDTVKVSNDEKQHRRVSQMRYISLMTKIMNIVVPANLKLRAGQILDLDFVKLTGGNRNEGADDEKLSGKYIIINLAHKFTREANNAATTHMTVVRDTDGKYIPEVEDESDETVDEVQQGGNLDLDVVGDFFIPEDNIA